MSGREWKPGDMAIRTWEGSHPQRSHVAEDCGIEHHDAGPHWHIESHGWDPIDVEHRHSKVAFRPLVVIDPEDYPSLLSIVQEMEVHRPGEQITRMTDRLQGALRKAANPAPPKPDEPTGLGAVVEDAGGSWWVRLNTVHWHSNAHPNNRHTWAEIAAVKVLSDGVTP